MRDASNLAIQLYFFFSSRRRHTRLQGDWSSDVCSSDLGGHLASTLLTHFDAGKPDASDPIEKQSSRPDAGILCYAVITMGEYTHQGSKNNLLGKDPSPELVKEVSNELQVTSNTPPCFIWH